MSAPEGAPAPVALDEAVEELYGLVRDDFIPRRDELAKQVRAAGDRETAAAIGRLRKPSVAAWLANVLAREHPDEIGALEGLGASMREAQQRLEGDALRRLSRQRHELLHALVERGRRIAREDGVRIGDAVVREVERTITAALADPEAARAMAAGRLVTALEPGAGLGNASAVSSVGASGATGDGSTSRAPVRPRTRRAPPPAAPDAGEAPEPDEDGARERDDRERARWEQERERLAGVVEDARAGAERAAAAVRDAEAGAEGARTEVTDAVSALAELRDRVAAAEIAEREARDRAAETERVAVASRRDAADADDRLRRAENDLAAHDG